MQKNMCATVCDTCAKECEMFKDEQYVILKSSYGYTIIQTAFLIFNLLFNYFSI